VAAGSGAEPPGTVGIRASPYRPLTIGIVTLVLLVAFEAMAVSTVMPEAVRELKGLAWYAWGFSAFMVASMFATVVSGDLSDRFGPAKPLAVGVGLFSGGLAIAGTAPVIAPFILGRAVQGLGGGTIVVALYVVAGRAYPEAMRPRVFAAFSAAWVLPAIVGPFVAGTVAEAASWRWVFLGLVPFAIVPLLLMVPRLRALPPPQGERTGRTGRKRLALAAAAGIGLLQYAGQELRLVSLAAAVGGLVLLLVGLPRLLPAGTGRFRRGLPSVVGMRGLVAGAYFGTYSFLPLILTSHRDLSATRAGVVLTVGALGWSAAAWWQGRPKVRVPRHRLVQVGTALVTAGIALVGVSVIPSVPVLVTPVGAVVAGLGMGVTMASLSVLLLCQSAVADQGANSAVAQLTDAMGQVASVGLGGVLFAALHTVISDTLVFGGILVTMLLVALLATALAGRVRAEA